MAGYMNFPVALQKKLYEGDYISKELKIAIFSSEASNYEYAYMETLGEENFVSESFQYNEGVIESSTFNTRQFSLPQAEIDIIYNGTRYKGKHAKIYMNYVYLDDNNAEQTLSIYIMPAVITNDVLSKDNETLHLTFEHYANESLNGLCNYWLIYAFPQLGVEETVENVFLYSNGHTNLNFTFPNLTTSYEFYYQTKARFTLSNKYTETVVPGTLTLDDLVYKNPLTWRELICQFLDFCAAHLVFDRLTFVDEREIIPPGSYYAQEDIENGDINEFRSTVRLKRIRPKFYNRVGANPVVQLDYYRSLYYDDISPIKYKKGVVVTNSEVNSAIQDGGILFATGGATTSDPDVYLIEENTFFRTWDTIGGTFVANIQAGIDNYLRFSTNEDWFTYYYSELEYDFVPTFISGYTYLKIDDVIYPILNCSVSGIQSMRCSTRNTATATKY